LKEPLCFFSEREKRKCSGGVNVAAHDFKTDGPILSAPDALVVCRVLNTLNTSEGLRDTSAIKLLCSGNSLMLSKSKALSVKLYRIKVMVKHISFFFVSLN